jgi:NarL family two-component system response regulator LiaR
MPKGSIKTADTYGRIIIEDHPLVREGLASYFAGTGRWEVKGTAAGLTEAKELVRRTEADIVLIDIQLEDGWGLDIIPFLNKSKTLAAVYSAFDDYSHVRSALGTGVKAYVCKRRDTQELENALLQALKGETYIDDTVRAKLEISEGLFSLLSKREAEILSLVKSGYANKEIADKLGIGQRRVENVLSVIYDKTGIKTRLALQKM